MELFHEDVTSSIRYPSNRTRAARRSTAGALGSAPHEVLCTGALTLRCRSYLVKFYRQLKPRRADWYAVSASFAKGGEAVVEHQRRIRLVRVILINLRK